jgi:hypothetical protein
MRCMWPASYLPANWLLCLPDDTVYRNACCELLRSASLLQSRLYADAYAKCNVTGAVRVPFRCRAPGEPRPVLCSQEVHCGHTDQQQSQQGAGNAPLLYRPPPAASLRAASSVAVLPCNQAVPATSVQDVAEYWQQWLDQTVDKPTAARMLHRIDVHQVPCLPSHPVLGLAAPPACGCLTRLWLFNEQKKTIQSKSALQICLCRC